MVKRKIKTGHEPWVRAQHRLGVRLRDLAVQQKTLARYTRAVQGFMWYCLVFFGQLADSFEVLDHQASCYIEYLWECGEGKSAGSEVLAGIQHFLVRKRVLPSSWTLMSIWNVWEMPLRTPPLPVGVLLALVGQALSDGFGSLAAALMVAWRGFLRTGELLSMRFCHFHVAGSKIVLALPLTKIGQRRGQQEVIAFDCTICARLLQNAAAKSTATDLLVPLGPYWFRNWWDHALLRLDVPSHIFKPYAIRRGGASWHFATTGNLEQTVFKGRWAQMATARTYIQEGLALLAQTRLSDQAMAACAACVAVFKACL